MSENCHAARLVTPFMVRMDADDIMHPERLEKQYQALIKHDSNTVIGSNAYSIDTNFNPVGIKLSRKKQRLDFQARYSFIHPTVTASTKWFRQNPYKESLIFQKSQDAELWYRTATNTEFINLPESLLYYRELGNFSILNYLGASIGMFYVIHQFYKDNSIEFDSINSYLMFMILTVKL